MIDVYTASRSKLLKIDLDKITSKGKYLIDCKNPTKKELVLLKKRFKLNQDDIESSLDSDSRSRVMEYDDHTMIIYNSATIVQHKPKTFSYGIYVSENAIMLIRNNKFNPIETFKKYPEDRKIREISKGPARMLFLFIDISCDNYFRLMDNIEEEVNKLEEGVFRNPDENTVRKIFKIKNGLIYIHKALTANREVIGGIEKGYIAMFRKDEIRQFRYVYNDVTELIDLESTYKDILTGAIEIYMSSVSNKLNDVMKKMTAMASFILIPTLISGIYGMNFSFMPELTWPHGYGFALLIMFVSVVIMYVYFKGKKWI